MTSQNLLVWKRDSAENGAGPGGPPGGGGRGGANIGGGKLLGCRGGLADPGVGLLTQTGFFP